MLANDKQNEQATKIFLIASAKSCFCQQFLTKKIWCYKFQINIPVNHIHNNNNKKKTRMPP